MTLNRFQINLLVIAGVYCGILFMLFVITDLVGPKRISFNGVLAIIFTSLVVCIVLVILSLIIQYIYSKIKGWEVMKWLFT